jgi:hypothetical protein
MRVRVLLLAAARQVPADRNARWQGALIAACLRGDVAWSWTRRFQHPRLRDLVAVTFADFSLRCSCSKQRIHSGLYDGLTWPDTGFASFD